MFRFKDFSVNKYHIANYIEFVDGQYDIYSSAFLAGLKTLTIEKITIITSDEFRPLLTSERIYGFKDLYWVLMYYNNVFDFLEWKSGLKIGYPSITAIDNLIAVLRSR